MSMTRRSILKRLAGAVAVATTGIVPDMGKAEIADVKRYDGCLDPSELREMMKQKRLMMAMANRQALLGAFDIVEIRGTFQTATSPYAIRIHAINP